MKSDKKTTAAESKPITHTIVTVRKAGVPIVCYETSDPAQTVKACLKALADEKCYDDDKNEFVPAKIQWDTVRGAFPLNEEASSLLGEMDGVIDLTECLKMLETKAPRKTLCFISNAQRFIATETVAQAIWNLRDVWKSNGSTLVLLCPTITLPPELSQDVVIITEPLPNAAEIETVVDGLLKVAGFDVAKVEHKDKVIDTLLGLSAFSAEQALALSLRKSGVDRDRLWDRKRKMIEQTPGLSVWRGGESFADLGGLDNLKKFLKKILTSESNPVRCVGFIDEIEKLFAGSDGDLSGISQDQLKVFLTEMQDKNIPGIILIGPPGTGKSAVAKAAGAIAEAEVLSIDTGAMKGGIVGSSEGMIRAAMKTFHAVSQGKGLFIATCNRIASLPPELRRRFTLGTFFVDLPSKAERKLIWPVWMKRYGIDESSLPPNDDGWTGAEIKNCCDVANRTGLSLMDAAKFIVPVCKSAADQIENLRKQASGRFISANNEGLYQYDAKQKTGGGRMVAVAMEMNQPESTEQE